MLILNGIGNSSTNNENSEWESKTCMASMVHKREMLCRKFFFTNVHEHCTGLSNSK